MRGFLICKRCREEVTTEHSTPWETPGEVGPGVAFAQTLWAALRSPRMFFAGLARQQSWLPAVVFGITCVTVGLLFATIWEFMLSEKLNDRLIEIMGQSHTPLPALRAMSFARAPLMAPLIVLFHTFSLHAALLIAGVKAQRAEVARIFGFSCAGYAFLLIPPIAGVPLGYVLTMVWLFNLEAAGIERFYGVGSIKATFIALVPLLIGVSIHCI